MGYFGNQWAYDSSNSWKEITKFDIEEEELVVKNKRTDTELGLINGNQFYFKITGFFNAKP